MPDLIDESSTFLSLIGQKSNVDVLTSVNIYRSTRNVSDELERTKGNFLHGEAKRKTLFIFIKWTAASNASSPSSVRLYSL